MIKMINEHKLNDKSKQIFNIMQAYNVTANLMEVEKIEFRLMEMVESQAILGKTFRINIHNNNRVSIVINQENTYEEVMKVEEKIKELVDPFYTIEIDGRTNPIKAKFRIDLSNLEDGKAFVGKMMDIIEMK